eukprot:1180502-Prorocentrum_minimum.AAC.11
MHSATSLHSYHIVCLTCGTTDRSVAVGLDLSDSLQRLSISHPKPYLVNPSSSYQIWDSRKRKVLRAGRAGASTPVAKSRPTLEPGLLPADIYPHPPATFGHIRPAPRGCQALGDAYAPGGRGHI